jgi:hypothetical protein
MAVLAILLLLAGPPAGAQSGQAILQRGPLAARGIPFLPPNVLRAYRGEYLAAETRIVVYFTRESLVLPAGWRPASCGQDTLLRVPDEEFPTFCYADPGEAGYSLFLSFESFEAEPFPWCAWTEAFLQRLRYLLAFSSEVPFPAVIEYGKSAKG